MVGAANFLMSKIDIWKDPHKVNQSKSEREMQKCKEALQGLSRKSRLNKQTMKNFLGSSPTG